MRYVPWALLIGSLAANGYLLFKLGTYEDAWVNQMIATSTVEQLMKEAAPGLSYERVKQLSEKRFGIAEEVTANEAAQSIGADKAALRAVGVTFLFKNGEYFGSKAALPDH